MTEIICSGFGGQGALTAGLLLAYAGIADGKNVTWFPSYGFEMRGGTANCNVKIDDEEIATPYVKKPDILFAMNEQSIERFAGQIKQDGLLIYNSSMVETLPALREDIKSYSVPATAMAVSSHNPRGANLIMAAYLIAVSGIFNADNFQNAVKDYFAKKGKPTDSAMRCVDQGYGYFKETSA